MNVYLLAIGLLSWVTIGCGANPTPQPTRAQAPLPSAEPLVTSVPTATAARTTSSDATPAQSSAVTDSAPPVPPSGEYEGIVGKDDGSQRSSPAVEQELRHLATEYQQLPPLTSLPDFLSVDDVLESLPVDDRDYLRAELHTQLQTRNDGRVLGAYLDSEEQYFLLWVPDAVGLSQVLTIYSAKGRVVERRHISRGRPLLREILELESEAQLARGYSATEVFIERITTMSVCCLPSVFEVYGLTTGGRLRKLLEYPKAHTDVGPGVSWEFLNHFEFDGTRLRVSPVVGASPGAHWDFAYRTSVGRYVPLQVTGRKSDATQELLPSPD